MSARATKCAAALIGFAALVPLGSSSVFRSLHSVLDFAPIAVAAATIQSVPGTIQAEDFDDGGSGVGYLDTTAGNSGGQYRATDVDIESTSDVGGGYSVGWAFAGEWLAYTVNVATAGTYDLEVRVASAGAGGTFHIEVNGVDRTGPLTVPNTG